MRRFQDKYQIYGKKQCQSKKHIRQSFGCRPHSFQHQTGGQEHNRGKAYKHQFKKGNYIRIRKKSGKRHGMSDNQRKETAH